MTWNRSRNMSIYSDKRRLRQYIHWRVISGVEKTRVDETKANGITADETEEAKLKTRLKSPKTQKHWATDPGP